MLEPWRAPLPLRRAWCLWELLCAIESPAVKLDVVLGPKEVRKEAKFRCHQARLRFRPCDRDARGEQLTRGTLLLVFVKSAAARLPLSPWPLRRQEEAFLRALLDDCESIRAALSRVDARKAECCKESDRDMIFDAVRRGCGFEGVNQAR